MTTVCTAAVRTASEKHNYRGGVSTTPSNENEPDTPDPSRADPSNADSSRTESSRTESSRTESSRTESSRTDHTLPRQVVEVGGKVLDELILDRIDALRVLRANTPEEKGQLLEEIGGRGKVEQDIVNELSKTLPLWRPDRFEEAHRMAMRSIEVLDRNGARAATMPRIGPLKPIASWMVGLITQWIVRGHQNTLITRIRKLYERREANSEWGTDEYRMLRRARINASQVEQGFKGQTLGLPTFLLGGAFLTTILSAIQNLLRSAIKSGPATAIFGAVLVLVLAAIAWAALYGAAVSRRRIRLCTDQPMKALWETIGAAGNPPRDASFNFALYAIVLTFLAWIVIPLVAWLVFRHNGPT